MPNAPIPPRAPAHEVSVRFEPSTGRVDVSHGDPLLALRILAMGQQAIVEALSQARQRAAEQSVQPATMRAVPR